MKHDTIQWDVQPCKDCGRPTSEQILCYLDGRCYACNRLALAADAEEISQYETRRDAKEAAAHAHDRYTAVAETGSCCGPHDANSPSPAGGCSWEERVSCGHLHLTRNAAVECGARLRNWSADGSSCSALWYHQTVHNQHGQRV